MTACKECGGKLGPRNTSGFCKRHAFKVAHQNPDFRANQIAGIKRKIAHDPVYKDRLRDQARALSRDLSIAKRRSRAFVENRTWEKGFAAAQTAEARAKAGRSLTARRLAWCPPELRSDYLELLYKHHIKAAEARRMIEAQHELHMARWRRSVGAPNLEAEKQGEAPEVEPQLNDLEPLDAAFAVVQRRFKATKDEVLSASRDPRIVVARRALAIALHRQGYSHPRIARTLGKSDHSSSIHWLKCGLKDEIADKSFAMKVAAISACWSAMELVA